MIGENIKKIRLSRKLGLNACARMVGISNSYLSNIERGLKDNPSMDTLQKIADVLAVPVNALLADTVIIEDLDENLNIPSEYCDKYKLTLKDKRQCMESIKKQTEAFFMDDEYDEESKKELLDALSEAFWLSKAKNKNKRNSSKK